MALEASQIPACEILGAPFEVGKTLPRGRVETVEAQRGGAAYYTGAKTQTQVGRSGRPT